MNPSVPTSASAPDLRPAEAWLSRRSPAERKRRGQWPTPWWLCAAVIEHIAADLGPTDTVVDPACGDGRWLLAVAGCRPGARLIGIDADPLAIEAARATLSAAGVSAELRCADALADGVVPPCDWIVGNPPFVRPQHLEREVARALWSRFATLTDKCDLAAAFVERGLEVAPRVALVLPQAVLSLASYAAVRRRLLTAGVDTVASVPADAFAAAVHTVVVVAGPSDRRRAGAVDPETGLGVHGGLAVSAHAWATDGALPELPGAPLGGYVRLHMGVVCGDYDRYVHPGRRHPEDRLTCRGRDVSRWAIADRGEHLWYVPADMLARKPYVAPKHAGLFDVPAKVVLAGATGRSLRAAVDEDRRFPLDSCYVGLPAPGAHPSAADPHAVVGLLLSSAVGAWYGARFRAARVKGVEVAQIPAPAPPWTEIADAARARDDRAVDAAVDRAYART